MKYNEVYICIECEELMDNYKDINNIVCRNCNGKKVFKLCDWIYRTSRVEYGRVRYTKPTYSEPIHTRRFR